MACIIRLLNDWLDTATNIVMPVKKFFSITMMMFLLCAAFLVSSGGCGGGSEDSSSAPDNETNLVQNRPKYPVIPYNPKPVTPAPTPIDEPEETIAPEPEPEPATAIIYEPEPELNPNLEGYVFLRWLDEDGNNFNFDTPVYDDITLTAEWAELEKVTDEELEELKEAVFGGKTSVAFSDSSLTEAEVTYDFIDSAGIVEISELTDSPVLGTAGLIGVPVSIKSDLSEFKKTTVTFHYDPDALPVSPYDLGIVWYDESNDAVVLMSRDTLIDTEANTIQVSANHFSIYGVVSVSEWQEAISKSIPKIRSGDVKYNVILAIDCSGSMMGSAIMAAVSSAQSLIDALSDEDYVSLISFSYYANEVLGTTKLQNSRQLVKDSISALYASGGTDIQAALEMALTHSITDSEYKNFVVLLSDGQSYIYSNVLQELKENSIQVITVGLGDVDQYLMESISDATDGSYLYASSSEQLQNKFEEVANIDLGVKGDDLDGDGLPDAVEEAGMKDLFGRMWYTDSGDADSDGDGFKDGEEIRFISSPYMLSSIIYVSNPNLPTEKEDSPLLSIPGKVYCIKDDISTRTLTLKFSITSYLYKNLHDKEIFYAPAEKEDMLYEVVDLPEGFRLDSLKGVRVVKLRTKRSDDGTQETEHNYYAEFNVRYPENQSRSLKAVNLKHINNTPGEMEITYMNIPVEYANTQIRSSAVDLAKSDYERIESQYIKALMKTIQEVQQDNFAMTSESFEALAKEIHVYPNNPYTSAKVPPKIKQVFAEAINKAITDSYNNGYNKMKLDEMANKPLKFITNFMKDWAKGVQGVIKSDTQTVTVGGTSYTVHTILSASEGAGSGVAIVSSGRQQWNLSWATSKDKLYTAVNVSNGSGTVAKQIIRMKW